MADNNTPSKFNYQDFVKFIKRYERENKKNKIKENYVNPYKYKKVFKKDKKQ